MGGIAETGKLRRGDLVALAASVGAPLALGGLGGVVTSRAIPTWYADLEKPDWNPPSWVFGPVWTTLYGLMGVAAWLIWRREREAETTEEQSRARAALGIYAVQLALNAIWSPTFFGLKRVDLAFGVIVAMLGAILETVRRFRQVRGRAAVLLLPYLAWVSFATVLNGAVWRLNPDSGRDAQAPPAQP